MTVETVFAIHTFEAESYDEIPFQLGEPIIVLEKDEIYKDGWWKGENIHGQVGLFPMNYTSYERPIPISPLNVSSPKTPPPITPTTPTSALNIHGSELDLPLAPFRMPSPSIDETIDDIQDKLQRMAVRTEEEPIYQNKLIHQQQYPWSPKNGHSSKLFMASSSGSSTTSSRMSSTGKQQSSPHSQFESVGSTKKNGIPSPSTTANGRQVNGHPATWGVDQVCMWLSERGFESEIHHFIENDITGDVLLSLNKSTLLKELNINSFGKRVHIMNAINELKSQFALNNENDDISDFEDCHHAQATTLYADSILNSQNSVYSNQVPDSSVSLHHQYGNISLPHMNELAFPRHLDSARTSTTNLSKNYPPTYYTYSQRMDDAEGANIETVLPKPSTNKKDKILAKFSFAKARERRSANQKKEMRTNSAGGWDFDKDEEMRELMKNNIMRNKSVGDVPYISLVPGKNRSLNFIQNRIKRPSLDRNSQLGLPKRSLDLEKIDQRTNSLSGYRNTDYFYENVVDNGDINYETLNEEPDYEGWLKKQGDKYKTWKSRYCVLKGITLFYFKNDKETEPSDVKGYINLSGYRIIPDENILHGKYGFKLIHDIERSHYFVHDDGEKMKGWMKAMMKSTISRDSKAPVISSSNIATVPLSEARKMTPRPPEPRRPSVSTSALNKISSPILRPMSPLSQRAGSPIPIRPLSPTTTIQNSSSLINPYSNNRAMEFF